ncbi:MAG: sodium:solute symporter family protein [Candidatus Eremiobacteraeota bacterium]|nr:sodium:solute symporter family protein [Candidatus Eremiobacteraeota bacterium]
MNSPSVALGIVALIVFGTIAFALTGVRKLRMTPAEYMIGGRSFGTIFLWVLMAGEIYTSFTFLGAAGWAYGKGAPAFYILAYGTLGYIGGYFLLPPIWRRAKERGFLTGPDFMVDQYGSRALGAGVAVLYFFFVVPYVTLQLSGLQVLLTLAGYGHFNAALTVAIAFGIITLFVFTAGLRGTAWASVIKDTLVIGAVVFAGIFLPIHFFGSPAAVFDRLVEIKPNWLTLQASGPYPPIWYVSTVLLTGAGYFMGPANMPAVYSARSEDTLRRNAMLLPIYQMILLLVFFAGFTALLVYPGLKGQAADQSFMAVVQHYYPSWVLGLIAGAGCLAALIPASALLLSAASMISKNVLGDIFNIATGDRARTLATRILIVIVAAMALVFWMYEHDTLVELLLLYYNAVTQMLPAFIFGLTWNRVTATAIACGIAGGLLTAAYLSYVAKITTWHGINIGLFALAINFSLVIAVTFLTPRLRADTRAKAPV